MYEYSHYVQYSRIRLLVKLLQAVVDILHQIGNPSPSPPLPKLNGQVQTTVQSTVQNCTSKNKCCCSGSVRIQIIHFLDPDMISVLQLSKISKDVKNRKELGLKNCVFLCVKTIASFFCRMACFTLICSVRIRTVHYNS